MLLLWYSFSSIFPFCLFAKSVPLPSSLHLSLSYFPSLFSSLLLFVFLFLLKTYFPSLFIFYFFIIFSFLIHPHSNFFNLYFSLFALIHPYSRLIFSFTLLFSVPVFQCPVLPSVTLLTIPIQYIKCCTLIRINRKWMKMKRKNSSKLLTGKEVQHIKKFNITHGK